MLSDMNAVFQQSVFIIFVTLYFSSGMTLLRKTQQEADQNADLFHPGHVLVCRFAGGQTEAMLDSERINPQS